ncbi:MAG TPA: hypothetical protein VF331_21710 [Polyangiales bacterium]
MSTSKGTDLLVLAAHAPELVGLRGTLGSSLAGVVRGLRVVCATVGVGMPVAGAGAMRQLREVKPRAALLIGSCGVYPKQGEHAPLDLVVPDKIALIDPTVLGGKAAFPAPMQTLIEPDSELCHGLATGEHDVHRGCVATTLSITIDDALASRLGRKSGCQTENLEAFSVALACAAADVPFATVLAVTNSVGSRGRQQWSKHQRKAAEGCGRLVLDWIHRGARGLPAR